MGAMLPSPTTTVPFCARPDRCRAWLACLAVIGGLACAQTATARDMTGKAGIGVMVSGAGLPTAALRYWRTHFAVEALFGWSTQQTSQPVVVLSGGHLQPAATGLSPSPDAVVACQAAVPDQRSKVSCAGNLDLSQSRIALGLLWRVADAPRASLIVGLRPWLQWSTQTLQTTTSVVYHGKTSALPATAASQSLSRQIGIEIPIIAEFFFNDHLSISGQVAIGMGAGQAPGAPTTSLQATTTDSSYWLGLHGRWSGGAGVTFYF